MAPKVVKLTPKAGISQNPTAMITRRCFPLQVVLKNEPVHPFGLAVYGDYIFWTDWVRRAVLRADKYTGADMKGLRADIPQQPMGIIAVANDTNSCKFLPPVLKLCGIFLHKSSHFGSVNKYPRFVVNFKIVCCNIFKQIPSRTKF